MIGAKRTLTLNGFRGRVGAVGDSSMPEILLLLVLVFHHRDLLLKLDEKVRVIMRVPEGYTKFWSNGHFGVGIADGIYWDIPTRESMRNQHV